MQLSMSQEINYNGAILHWAIGRAGTSLEKLEKASQTSGLDQQRAHPTLNSWKIVSYPARPFGYLFLDSPPNEPIPFPFFRTTGSTNTRISLNLYDTILLNQRRQDWLRIICGKMG